MATNVGTTVKEAHWFFVAQMGKHTHKFSKVLKINKLFFRDKYSIIYTH